MACAMAGPSFDSNRRDFNVDSEDKKTKGKDRLGPDPASRNDAAAIFGELNVTVSRLDQAYRKFDEVSQKGLVRLERSTALDFDRALSQMYTASVVLETAGSVQSYLDERGVKPHGNVKNPYALLVKAYVGSAHRSLKSALCKRAAVIALARRHDVAPGDFEAWRKLWPVERACEEFRRLSNQGGDASDVSDKLDTRGLTGQKVARVEFAANGSGKVVKVIEILPDDNGDAAVPSTATPA
jgi:hypothetical protein